MMRARFSGLCAVAAAVLVAATAVVLSQSTAGAATPAAPWNTWTCLSGASPFRFVINARDGAVPVGTTWQVTSSYQPSYQLQVQSTYAGLSVTTVSTSVVQLQVTTEVPKGTSIQLKPSYFQWRTSPPTLLSLVGRVGYTGNSVSSSWTATQQPCNGTGQTPPGPPPVPPTTPTTKPTTPTPPGAPTTFPKPPGDNSSYGYSVNSALCKGSKEYFGMDTSAGFLPSGTSWRIVSDYAPTKQLTATTDSPQALSITTVSKSTLIVTAPSGITKGTPLKVFINDVERQSNNSTTVELQPNSYYAGNYAAHWYFGDHFGSCM